ncbi:hypothetical protein BIT28_07850 [Photobacterium proteolyticum]|jgi:hypothetical protein|uniref:Uncharacterized protein n=2 Tax=Photobacterium TaxID=657 RepID=A0A1Q9H0R5_9GAMM|nr:MULTISPECIES: hypothetical protein [Photobacterium]MCG7586413.1 hypothetical protein [Photobacterium sp. OFAV2-7]NBI54535.1 hypothetical protein [Photobacterium alginatilyticum]OLQ81131.1 hypothetical protein BIT28_07850 [Photobacterium proteolyticum]
MDSFAAAEKALTAMLKNVDSTTGTIKEERVDYRQMLIDFADEVPGRQKAVIKRIPLQKINDLIAVLHEFKDEARQVRMTEILALMEKDGVHPEDLVEKEE